MINWTICLVVETLQTDILVSGEACSTYGHLLKTLFFLTPILTLYFYIPVSGQLQLWTPFLRPDGFCLRELLL